MLDAMKTGVCAMLAVIFAAFAPTADAKTYKGNWAGKSATSLTFLKGKRVRYCYKRKCTVQRYRGSKNSKIRFRWGTGRYTFRKTKSGYRGTYQVLVTTRVRLR